MEFNSSYEEKNSFSLSPEEVAFSIQADPTVQLAIVDIVFETPGTADDVKTKMEGLRNRMPQAAFDFMTEPLDDGGALLTTDDVTIDWGAGGAGKCLAMKLIRFLTHGELDGEVVKFHTSRSLKDGNGNPVKPHVLRQYRQGDNGTFIWFALNRKVQWTFVLAAPATVKTGALQFHDLPPIDLELWLPRTWTDRSGRKLQASFLQLTGGEIELKRASDGKIFKTPLTRFSDEDQTFVKTRL